MTIQIFRKLTRTRRPVTRWGAGQAGWRWHLRRGSTRRADEGRRGRATGRKVRAGQLSSGIGGGNHRWTRVRFRCREQAGREGVGQSNRGERNVEVWWGIINRKLGVMSSTWRGRGGHLEYIWARIRLSSGLYKWKNNTSWSLTPIYSNCWYISVMMKLTVNWLVNSGFIDVCRGTIYVARMSHTEYSNQISRRKQIYVIFRTFARIPNNGLTLVVFA